MSNTAQSLASTRIASLLDENSFVEIGGQVTARSTDFNMAGMETPSDGVITGYGVINGSLVYVYSQDASVMGGTIGEMHAKKIARLYEFAQKTGAPVIGLVDCAGMRLQEATDALNGFGEIYMAQAMACVWLPEKLHPVCANKLLKLLEEPPERTIFLLVSEKPNMILPTIQSRTQRMNVRKIDEASIDRVLQTKYSIQPADSLSIAHLANGNFIKALETIHLNEENQLFFDLFVSLMRLSYQRKIRGMKMWSEQVAGMGRERQKNFLEYCQRMIRENFIFNLHQRDLTYMTISEQNFATRFAPFVNERNVMGIMDELSEAQIHIEQNVNAKMVFFDFSLKMIVLLKQ